MKLMPALEYEAQREASAINAIYIHKEGKFYHIYEWSAWLVKTIVCTEEFQQERGDAKLLAANRYNAKGKEYVMLGFPVESLSKYIPDYEDVRQLDGDDLVVTITLPEGASYEEMQVQFDEWKTECPVKESKTRKRADIVNSDGKAPALARSGLFSIASRVVAYQLENSTPAQNIEFISKLKQDIIGLLL